MLTTLIIFQDDRTKGCVCPPGFKGDGVSNCEGTFFVSYSRIQDDFSCFLNFLLL